MWQEAVRLIKFAKVSFGEGGEDKCSVWIVVGPLEGSEAQGRALLQDRWNDSERNKHSDPHQAFASACSKPLQASKHLSCKRAGTFECVATSEAVQLGSVRCDETQVKNMEDHGRRTAARTIGLGLAACREGLADVGTSVCKGVLCSCSSL